MEVKMGMEVYQKGKGDNLSCHGYLPRKWKGIPVTVKEVKKVFGKPAYYYPEDLETGALWAGTIDGWSFEIYDYERSKPLSKNTNWHIGAENEEVANKVRKYFTRKRG